MLWSLHQTEIETTFLEFDSWTLSMFVVTQLVYLSFAQKLARAAINLFRQESPLYKGKLRERLRPERESGLFLTSAMMGKRLFELIDVNKSGRISRQEFCDACHDLLKELLEPSRQTIAPRSSRPAGPRRCSRWTRARRG